jgi:hypothetical protein
MHFQLKYSKRYPYMRSAYGRVIEAVNGLVLGRLAGRAQRLEKARYRLRDATRHRLLFRLRSAVARSPAGSIEIAVLQARP